MGVNSSLPCSDYTPPEPSQNQCQKPPQCQPPAKTRGQCNDKQKLAASAACLPPPPADDGEDCDCEDECQGVLGTAPFDPRFPNQNQTKHCYTSFLDFHRCTKARGEDYEPCKYFERTYKSLCPNAWIAKWEEQMEAGTFPVKFE